jgi:hypothetical protein
MQKFEPVSQKFSLDGSVGTATRLRIGQSGFDSPQEQNIFIVSETSRPALPPLPIQLAVDILSPRIDPCGGFERHVTSTYC